MTSVLSIWQYVGITYCFSLVILNFPIYLDAANWQIQIITYHVRQIKENNYVVWFGFRGWLSLTMFDTILKIEFLFVVDFSWNMYNFFYHNLNFMFDIFFKLGFVYTLNIGYEFVCTICYNILKMTVTARMSLKTTIEVSKMAPNLLRVLKNRSLVR
jgi:hypothetical protein